MDAIGIVISKSSLHAGDRASSPDQKTSSRLQWRPTAVQILPKMEVPSQYASKRGMACSLEYKDLERRIHY